MKKYAAKILLTVSGALMLGLSVLPHHHHGDVIHFGVVERCETCQDCQDNSRQGQWDAVAHKHTHSSDADTDCDLRQLFVVSAREEQLLPVCLCDGQGGHPAFDHFTLTLFYHATLPLSQTDETGELLKFPPLTQPLGSLLPGHIFALRAPPAVIA